MTIPKGAASTISLWAAVLIAQRTGLAQCSIVGTLVKSFFPQQISESYIRSFGQITTPDLEQQLLHGEQTLLSQFPDVGWPEGEGRLRNALARFYAVGAEHYGVRLEPEVRVVNTLDLNAFATGHVVNMDLGLLLYFLNPREYWGKLGHPEISAYTDWANDWDSVYAVLAHEASHNLMRHQEQTVLETAGSMIGDYDRQLRNQRKIIANGQSWGGVKGYVWDSLSNFLEQLNRPQQQQKRETEADVVSLTLLKGAGLEPATAYRVAQRLDLFTQLVSANPTSVGGAVRLALCSDHPGWVQRMQDEAANLNCLNSNGNLCEGHVTFPGDQFVARLHTSSGQAERYAQQTAYYANLAPDASGQRVEARIRLKPKDAQLFIDNERAAPGVVPMTLGRHAILARRDGYRPVAGELVAFPDIQPNVQIKLKKVKGHESNSPWIPPTIPKIGSIQRTDTKL